MICYQRVYSRRTNPFPSVRPFSVLLSFTENRRVENGRDCNGTVQGRMNNNFLLIKNENPENHAINSHTKKMDNNQLNVIMKKLN